MHKTTNNALAQQHTPKSKRLWQFAAPVAKRFSADAAPEEVQTAIAGHYEQIRHLPADVQETTLMAEVLALAKQYGARADVDAGTINEAVDFIVSSFPWLGVRELRTAFRWHASGKTATNAGEMYGGLFNVRALGAILTEYNELRKKIVAHHLELMAQAEAESKEEAQKEEKRRAFENNLLASVKRARVQKLPWQSIPADWHDWLLDRGKLEYTKDEKRKAWEDSAALAEQERNEEKHEVNPFKAVALKNKDLTARRVAIAKKLLVHRKLIS